MVYSFYQMCYIVLIYGFLGWCTEVIYAAVNSGKFVNRGFLNGPICPIYGFGMLTVLSALNFVKDNIILLFVGGVLLTSALEFITGFILEKLFSAKWWDYSNVPFNICGYICLKFSLMWGFAVVFVVKIVHKPIEFFLNLEPTLLTKILLSVLMVLFLADIITTVVAILKLPAKLRAMNELDKLLRKTSDEIGKKLYEGTFAVENSYEKVQKNFEEKREEFKSVKAEAEKKYREILKSDNIISRRLLNAFPNLAEKRKNVKELLSKKFKK